MKKTALLDANVIIRFLLNDHPKLSLQAKKFFSQAEKGLINLYLDEVVLAEVIWTLSSFYKIKKTEIIDRLKTLLAQDWLVNPKKELLLEALGAYRRANLDYIDCWILVVSKSLGVTLETFDQKLSRKKKQSPKR